MTLAGYVLPVSRSAGRANAIVALGGFGVPRAELAAQLFLDGVAPLVVVTGAGDCDAMRDILLARGVPAKAILTECASRSTQENAAFASGLLRRAHVRSAVLVTHWFHARRALAAFRAALPEMQFTAEAVRPSEPSWRVGWVSTPGATLAEFTKILWYALRYGIVAGPQPEQFAAVAQ
ncbi:YdcF family protein [Hansschlegelia quercus]|uniref:YdcF family protein n=1 Tax=Hansschlegelia quercus TaxID=2528245 RepID=UPI0013EF131E|nr:YdcF family protein [Hansschlegelia quercus]